MTSPASGVALPERLGRRMSIGPFEDPRDFLRCLLLVSAGAVPAVLFGAWAWAPFLLAAVVLTLVRSEEETLWTRLGHRVGFLLRRRAARGGEAAARRGARRPLPEAQRPRGVGGGPGPWSVWEHPPWHFSGRSSEELLQEALGLLRPLGNARGEVYLARIPTEWDVRRFLPPSPTSPSPTPDPGEVRLRNGYASLLRLVTEGRFRARVILVLPCTPPGPLAPAGSVDPAEGLHRLGWRRLGPSVSGGSILSMLRSLPHFPEDA